MEPYEAVDIAAEIAPCEGINTLSEVMNLLDNYDVPY